jgi:acyl carrier protein
MKTENIKTKLLEILSSYFIGRGFDIESIRYADLIDDAGLDSVTFISVVVEIEDAFNITIPDEMLIIENFRNATSIIEITEKEVLKIAAEECTSGE